MEWSIFGSSNSGRTLLILFGIYHFVHLGGALSIVGQPRSQAVHEGRSLILECIIDSSQTPYVIWYKKEGPGSNIPLSTHRVIRQDAPEVDRLSIVGSGNAYNLRITNSNPTDDSKYQCYAHSRGQVARSAVAKVTILPRGESVQCQLYPQHASIGTILNYTCSAPPSISNPMLTWWHGDQPISSVEELPDGRLRLRYIIGQYDNYVPFTCTVGDNIYEASGLNCSIVPLTVPLTGRLEPEYNKVTIGSNAAFRCSASAAPAVNKIKWIVGYGPGSKVQATGGRYEIKNDPRDATTSTLIIRNIAASDNGTDVRCVLMNEIRQRDIVTAHVFVSIPIRPPTTLPVATAPRTTMRVTQRPHITTQQQTARTNAITSAPPTPTLPRRTSAPTQTRPVPTEPPTKLPVITTRLYQPRMKDVEIAFHGDATPQIAIIPVLVDTGVTDAGDSSASSNSSLIPTVATLSILLILFIVAGVVVYVVFFRRKVINKNTFEVQYRPSFNHTGAELTLEERSAARMSLRLQTIEVVVNQPPPEWQSRLKDVKPVENEYTNFAPKPLTQSSPPNGSPPAYTPNPPIDMQITPSPRTSQHSSVEDPEDAVYAMPAKKTSNKRDGGNTDNNNKETRSPAKRQISDASRRRLLSQEFEDEEIEWDQSSWDNSSFEDETETVDRIHGGQMYTLPAETIYANTSSLTRDDDSGRDSYGPAYGNLPSHMQDVILDPTYSRVASLTDL